MGNSRSLYSTTPHIDINFNSKNNLENRDIEIWKQLNDEIAFQRNRVETIKITKYRVPENHRSNIKIRRMRKDIIIALNI